MTDAKSAGPKAYRSYASKASAVYNVLGPSPSRLTRVRQPRSGQESTCCLTRMVASIVLLFVAQGAHRVSRAARLVGRVLGADAHPTRSAATATYVTASVGATSYRNTLDQPRERVRRPEPDRDAKPTSPTPCRRTPPTMRDVA